MPNRIDICIDGSTYFLETDLPGEYLDSIVSSVNRHVRACVQNDSIDKKGRVTITALNIMNEYWQYRIGLMYRVYNLIKKLEHIDIYEN